MTPFLALENAGDPLVDDYRSISDPHLLLRRGLFVAEGRLVVRRVIEDGRYSVQSLLISEAARRDLEDVLARLDARVPILVCEAGEFLHITGFNIHRGCLAVVARPAPLPIDAVVRDARVALVLEGVANADNVGGVFRNAAAFGAGAVLLSPSCCDPLYRKAIRTSMAAALRVPFVRLEDWPNELETLRARGFRLVALTPRQPSWTLDEFVRSAPTGPLALLVGNEGAGLSAEVETAADDRVRIPIRPEVDSLNLSVATGIALSRLSGCSQFLVPSP